MHLKMKNQGAFFKIPSPLAPPPIKYAFSVNQRPFYLCCPLVPFFPPPPPYSPLPYPWLFLPPILCVQSWVWITFARKIASNCNARYCQTHVHLYIIHTHIHSLTCDLCYCVTATIFAYGQTSSGKSYTMLGDENASLGIIPSSLLEIFEVFGQVWRIKRMVIVIILKLFLSLLCV